MKLFTMNFGGVIEPGIDVSHGFFTLGKPKGSERLIQMLDSIGEERVFGAVIGGSNSLRKAPKDTPVPGSRSGSIGMLIRNQAATGEYWELGGKLIGKCSMFGKTANVEKLRQSMSNVCPYCKGKLDSNTGFYEMYHIGFIFNEKCPVRPLFAGYVPHCGPEYFLIVEPHIEFSIRKKFPLFHSHRDLIVRFEDCDNLTVWTPERYARWKDENSPMTYYTKERNGYAEV